MAKPGVGGSSEQMLNQTRASSPQDRAPAICRLVRPAGPPDPSPTARTAPETEKPRELQGFLEEWLKGLEPSTFCMASGRDANG
jgi:hypothetical protein